MDIYRIIGQLVQERNRLEKIIKSLEDMKLTGKAETEASNRRRGRKSMDGVARTEVSARMKRYWAQRRLDDQLQKAKNA